MTSTGFDGTNRETFRIKILIADDDLPTCKLLSTAITKWGYEVVEARNGQEAWEALNKPFPPQMLILDWMMPKVDGLQLCARIREELKHTNPYIILLTQSSGAENIIKGLEAGANEFLSKPPNMAELRSRISVGEKIIRYENALAEQNQKLHNYIAQIEKANNLVLNASQKLANAMRALQSSSFRPADGTQELEEIGSQLANIMGMFNEFQPENKRKK